MNKEKYRAETDSVVPSDEFKESLSKLPESKKQKKKGVTVYEKYYYI